MEGEELSAWSCLFGPHAECWLFLGQRKREEMLPASSWGEGDLIDDEVKRVETIEQNEGRERVNVCGELEAGSEQKAHRLFPGRSSSAL